jgi:hypothetical protein
MKHSKDLLNTFNCRSYLNISSMQTFNFSTLYTTILHEYLKTWLKEIIHNAFRFKKGKYHYKCIVLDHELTYLVKH